MGRIRTAGIRMRCGIRPAQRRTFGGSDFTINGLLLDPEKMVSSGPRKAKTPQLATKTKTWRGWEHPVVIDYVGGLADLDSGIVRAIGQPDEPL